MTNGVHRNRHKVQFARRKYEASSQGDAKGEEEELGSTNA